jgi:hypothetical protein
MDSEVAPSNALAVEGCAGATKFIRTECKQCGSNNNCPHSRPRSESLEPKNGGYHESIGRLLFDVWTRL